MVPWPRPSGSTSLTPASFLNAVSEGTSPTAQDKATIDQEIKGKPIKVYIYNSQNATPDMQAQVTEAQAAGIPVVTITETLERLRPPRSRTGRSPSSLGSRPLWPGRQANDVSENTPVSPLNLTKQAPVWANGSFGRT